MPTWRKYDIPASTNCTLKQAIAWVSSQTRPVDPVYELPSIPRPLDSTNPDIQTAKQQFFSAVHLGELPLYGRRGLNSQLIYNEIADEHPPWLDVDPGAEFSDVMRFSPHEIGGIQFFDFEKSIYCEIQMEEWAPKVVIYWTGLFVKFHDISCVFSEDAPLTPNQEKGHEYSTKLLRIVDELRKEIDQNNSKRIYIEQRAKELGRARGISISNRDSGAIATILIPDANRDRGKKHSLAKGHRRNT